MTVEEVVTGEAPKVEWHSDPGIVIASGAKHRVVRRLTLHRSVIRRSIINGRSSLYLEHPQKTSNPSMTEKSASSDATAGVMSSSFLRRDWFPRAFPFILYMAFIAVESLVSWLAGHIPSMAAFSGYDHYVLYPVKTVLVGAALIYYWRDYTELRGSRWFRAGDLATAISAGVVVFVLWINMDFASFGNPEGFDPYFFDDGAVAFVLVAFRLFGAAVVVPVFEEIFWRSLVVRYFIDSDFMKVPVGAFTWASFLGTSLLFGLEHHLWLAGIAAGIVYNLLLYRTRNIKSCILAHGITNLLLGIYVLKTGNWHFW